MKMKKKRNKVNRDVLLLYMLSFKKLKRKNKTSRTLKNLKEKINLIRYRDIRIKIIRL